MAEFIQGLDPSKLVLVQTVLSFAISPFAAPVYNLPIFLFGMYAQESAEAVQSLKTFTGILSISTIFDIIWMVRNHQHGFIRFITIVILILKLPTMAAFAVALRQRGAQFSGLGANLSGPTVWSMPGGFTSSSRDGYQVVDDEPRAPQPKATAPPTQPSTPANPSMAGAYQSV